MLVKMISADRKARVYSGHRGPIVSTGCSVVNYYFVARCAICMDCTRGCLIIASHCRLENELRSPLMSDISVVHHPERSCFTISSDGVESILQYQRSGNSLDFNHTYVPSALRGKGLAEKLVRHGIVWARAEGLDITASCWYAARFL